MLSGQPSLDHGHVSPDGDDVRQPEAVGGEGLPVLRLRPLAAPGHDHPGHVGQLAERLPAALGQDVLARAALPASCYVPG
jgi:hypothetical protein